MAVTSHVGWDIGIKNLAHCLIRKIPESQQDIQGLDNVLTIGANRYQIPPETWDVIDFSQGAGERLNDRGEMMLNQRPAVLCQVDTGKLKNGATTCRRKAVFCVKERVGADAEYTGYCAMHFKKGTVPRETVVEIKPTSCACCMDGCTGKAWYLEKSHLFLGYCKKHYNGLVKTRAATEFYKIIKSKKVTAMDLTDLIESLFTELDRKPALTHVHQILLENQPVLKGPTMKTIQSFLYAYYVLRGRMDAGVARVNKTIQCYFAANKLDLIKYVDPETITAIAEELKGYPEAYGKNKRLAIVLIDYYLTKHGTRVEALRAKFDSCDKQDDMADSLLMTLHALEKPGLTKIKNVDVGSVGIQKRKKADAL